MASRVLGTGMNEVTPETTTTWEQSSLSSWFLSWLTQVMVAEVVGTAGVIVRENVVVGRTVGVEVSVGRSVLEIEVVILKSLEGPVDLLWV